MKQFIFVLIFICSLNSFAAENSKFYPNKVNYCKISKIERDNYEPAQFNPTNNLLCRSGAEPFYCGTKIIIKGIVLDEKCVPIPDAKVYLWQVGCDGKYPYIPLRTRVNKKLLNLSGNSTFQGSGIATTNNMGEFYFVTLYPRAISKSPAYVNIRVQHRDLGTLQTKLYLVQGFILDEEVQRLKNLRQDRIYNFTIVMPGQTLKRY